MITLPYWHYLLYLFEPIRWAHTVPAAIIPCMCSSEAHDQHTDGTFAFIRTCSSSQPDQAIIKPKLRHDFTSSSQERSCCSGILSRSAGTRRIPSPTLHNLAGNWILLITCTHKHTHTSTHTYYLEWEPNASCERWRMVLQGLCCYHAAEKTISPWYATSYTAQHVCFTVTAWLLAPFTESNYLVHLHRWSSRFHKSTHLCLGHRYCAVSFRVKNNSYNFCLTAAVFAASCSSHNFGNH